MNKKDNQAKLGYTNNQTQPPMMAGKPVPQAWQVNLENWDAPPYNRWAFNHCSEFIPSAVIARDEKNALFFDTNYQSLDNISFTNSQNKKTSVKEYMETGHTDALVMYHKGKIVYEKYFAFTKPTSRHLMQSMTKSVVGVVAQKLKHEKILNPDALIETILPELKNTGYAGATVQQALDMRTGIDFKETYFDTPLEGDCYLLDVANGWKPMPNKPNICSDSFSLAQTFKNTSFPHGERMVYRCLETDVIGHCIEKLTGAKLADLISTFVWQPMGAEADAYITVDPLGYAIASGGMCARARDMLKFGVMMAEDGFINGKQLLPANLVAECYNPAPYKFDNQDPELNPHGGYKNYFWIKTMEPQVIACSGVFGQHTTINKTNNVVIVQFSSWLDHGSDTALWLDMLEMHKALTKAVL